MTLLHERCEEFADRIAVQGDGGRIAYSELVAQASAWRERLRPHAPQGRVVLLNGDFDASFIGALLALFEARSVAVPLSTDAVVTREYARTTSMAQLAIDSRHPDQIETLEGGASRHEIFDRLRDREHSGLVLFTSGSTGDAKAAVHDADVLMQRYQTRRTTFRTLAFLQLDHIGGVNTLMYTLANGGCVTPVGEDRSPTTVCRLIHEHAVELLPTSPTFLNLLLLSGAHKKYDCSSLARITYGTEPMPQSTLDRLHEAFPNIVLQQTYGMTELGILSSKSRGNDSLWVRLGGAGFDIKVVDGRLWIRAETAMMGYLNAASPFDDEGYLDTGDMVEQDGEWFRILGRSSEIINVGGNKVYPAEVESTLLEMPGVVDASVSKAPHPLTGNVVTATVRLEGDESKSDFKVRMRAFCRDRLPSFAVPAKIELATSEIHNARFKRLRRTVES